MKQQTAASVAGTTEHRCNGRSLTRLMAACGSAFVIALFFALPSVAAAADTVVLDGAGTGTVQGGDGSNPPNEIDCTNSGNSGSAGTGACSFAFPFFAAVELTAKPDPDSIFVGWTGTAFPEPGVTCNSGNSNPCTYLSTDEAGAPATITATFAPRPGAPLAVTGDATAGGTTATMEGAVDPEGAVVDQCRFEYGTSAGYGASVPCAPGAAALGSGSDPQAVSAQSEPLEGGTTYHYRLVASGPGGISFGDDRTFATAGSPQCPEASSARRAEQGIAAVLLPACMALEMVSPPQKRGQAARFPQISADGNRVRFHSLAALGGTPSSLSVFGDPYVATRGADGWGVAPTSPAGGIVSGWDRYALAESFSPDFSRWFHLGATAREEQLGLSRTFRAGLGGFLSPLSPLVGPMDGGDEQVVRRSEFRGASADHSHLYFEPGESARYLSGDPVPTGSDTDGNTYVAHLDATGNPSLELLARDSDDKVWGGSCGARLGGFRVGETAADPLENGRRVQGAVSPDGRRVYFSTRPDQPAGADCDPAANGLRIMERREGVDGPWIGYLFSSECDRTAPACDPADGDDLYQGASVDGTRVYFTTTRQLADTDIDDPGSSSPLGEYLCQDPFNAYVVHSACDLYLYDSTLPPGERLVQVSRGENSAGHEAGKGAGVRNGIAAISGDGSHVYFVADGVLTTDPNPAGDSAQPEAPNLYAWDRETESTAFVGTLDTADEDALWGREGTFRNGAYPVPVLGRDSAGNEIGGDGHVLLFQSKASLTGDDLDGGYRDVFRYDALSGDLERITKAAQGGSDDGSFEVELRGLFSSNGTGTDFAEIGRWVSEDGNVVAFLTGEGLARGDIDGEEDFYLWRDGRVFELPGRPYLTIQGNQHVLSHDGSEVAFQTLSPLLPQDGDSSADVYVARVGGGYPLARTRDACQPDPGLAGRPCQGTASQTPQLVEPATGSNAGGDVGIDGCGELDLRAKRFKQRAKLLRQRADRAPLARQARRLRRKAVRLTRRANNLRRLAATCKRANGGAAR